MISPTLKADLSQLIARQAKFLETARDVRTSQFLSAAAQLCHMDTNLAESVWLDMFPRLWAILNSRQQEVIVILIYVLNLINFMSYSFISYIFLRDHELPIVISLHELNKNICFYNCFVNLYTLTKDHFAPLVITVNSLLLSNIATIINNLQEIFFNSSS